MSVFIFTTINMFVSVQRKQPPSVTPADHKVRIIVSTLGPTPSTCWSQTLLAEDQLFVHIWRVAVGLGYIHTFTPQTWEQNPDLTFRVACPECSVITSQICYL